ncbi:hypothetical protein [Rhizobium sp. WYJ-E13]|uniref:hypothetical protein n=1 Tax=Rhizobium sp. WYJ-E13 TaxID=2849093 RepID=UPI001C1E8E0B|nr:hypothetical protein [Rhizobium sp. WYJ-E13]QWW71913.1 hypothetical protein KQ933_25215 [Rhizobium sp. WYJ-E13]
MDGQRFNFFRAFLLAAVMLPFMLVTVGYSLICGVFERRLGVDLWLGLVSDPDDSETIDSIARI